MKIIRFAASPDGGSQFVEIDLAIDNASTDAWDNTSRRSATLPAQSAMVTEMPDGLYQDWHPASRRQLLFPCRRCRQPRPPQPHDRRPGPRAVRSSAARS